VSGFPPAADQPSKVLNPEPNPLAAGNQFQRLIVSGHINPKSAFHYPQSTALFSDFRPPPANYATD